MYLGEAVDGVLILLNIDLLVETETASARLAGVVEATNTCPPLLVLPAAESEGKNTGAGEEFSRITSDSCKNI